MTTILKAGIVGAIAVAGVGMLLVLQHPAQVRLREENKSLKAERGRLSDLAAQALPSPGLSTDQLSELEEVRGNVESLRKQTNEMERLRQQHMELARQLNWKEPDEFMPIERWTDAGTSTAPDALLTFFWASKHQQHDRTERVADVQALRDEFIRMMRESGTDPDGRFTVGRVWFREDLSGFQIKSQWQNSPDEVELEVALTCGDGTMYVDRPKLQRVGGEWKLDLRSGLVGLRFETLENE